MNKSWIKVKSHPDGRGVYSIECTHDSHTETDSHRFLIDEGYAYVGGDQLWAWMLKHAHEGGE